MVLRSIAVSIKPTGTACWISSSSIMAVSRMPSTPTTALAISHSCRRWRHRMGSVSIPANSSYTDAGATTADNIDGDVTPVATSTVNTSVVGSYTVTYEATDRAGNAAEPVVRTVTAGAATGGGGGGATGIRVLALLLLAVAAGITAVRAPQRITGGSCGLPSGRSASGTRSCRSSNSR
jgi:hypothetical protein